jgi:hypothetical protein
MSSIANVANPSVPDSSKRSYISSTPFQASIFNYVPPVRDAYGVIVTPGQLVAFSTTSPSGAAASGSDCPAKRVLRETGKKLFPDVHSGILTPMVSVYDNIKLWRGYIDPNAAVFASYSTNTPNFFLNGVDAVTGAPPDAGAPVITNGLVNAGQSVTAGTGITSTTGNITASAGIVYAKNGIGYPLGSGGTVIQSSSKTTAVTLNKPTGTITMNAATLNANATAAFTLNNSFIGANDMLIVRSLSDASLNYSVGAGYCVAGSPGSCDIYVKNVSGVSLSEALVLQFVIIKAAIA